ncbi:flagellar export protein FliJ [Fusibacter bizertensis]
MKKFLFRYESVLKMRLDKEDQIKNEMAKIISKRQIKVDELEKLNSNAILYDQHIEKLLSEGNASSEMYLFNQGKSYYKKQRDRLIKEIANLDHQIVLTQAMLVEAMKERKIMEKLKETAMNEFIESINDADAKLIEEVVNFSNNKKNGD